MSNWLIIFLAGLASLVITNILNTIEKVATMRYVAEHLRPEEIIKAIEEECDDEQECEMEE